jgi:hypothetical protein
MKKRQVVCVIKKIHKIERYLLMITDRIKEHKGLFFTNYEKRWLVLSISILNTMEWAYYTTYHFLIRILALELNWSEN